jgi:hypothetical protein
VRPTATRTGGRSSGCDRRSPRGTTDEEARGIARVPRPCGSTGPRSASDVGGQLSCKVEVVGNDPKADESDLMRNTATASCESRARAARPSCSAALPGSSRDRSSPRREGGPTDPWFAVDDIEDVVARLRTHGVELVGELAQCEDTIGSATSATTRASSGWPSSSAEGHRRDRAPKHLPACRARPPMGQGHHTPRHAGWAGR